MENQEPGKNADEISNHSGKNKKLANSLGTDERGMKTYMLVILKTGPKRC